MTDDTRQNGYYQDTDDKEVYVLCGQCYDDLRPNVPLRYLGPAGERCDICQAKDAR